MATVSNTGEHLRIPGLVAAADLSAKQYHVVALASTAKQVKTAAAATGAVVGILQNDPLVGEAASVVGAGMTKAYSGAVIAAGDLVTANSTGQCIATTTANNKVIGKAITAASGTAVLFEVFVAMSNV